MQIPLLRGRLFTEHDTRETPRVVVIDDRMAEALWPNEDPIGKRLRRGGMDADANAPWLTVIGVVVGWGEPARSTTLTLIGPDGRPAVSDCETLVNASTA